MSSRTSSVPKENIEKLLPNAVAPSKEQLEAYWRKVGIRALRYIGRRPLRLVRHVDGITFFHKGPLPPIPRSVHRLKFEKREGGEGTRVWVEDLAGLLGLVEMDAVELHPWGAQVDDIEKPDVLVFNLLPGEGVGFDFVVESALRLRQLLGEVGLDSWLKSPGDESLHVMAPVERTADWETARAFARLIAQRLEAIEPGRYTLSQARNARPGKLLIDYLRNGRGNTTIGTYSPRARPGFPVALPVSWERVKPGARLHTYTMTKPPLLSPQSNSPPAPRLRVEQLKPRRPGLLKNWKVPTDLFLEPSDPEDLDAAEGQNADEFGITLPPPHKA